MKQFTLNAFLTAVALIGLSNLFSHALSLEANQVKDNTFVTQSVLVDQDGQPLFNYYIDANGNVVNLQPYFDHESDAINRISLKDEEQPKPDNDKPTNGVTND